MKAKLNLIPYTAPILGNRDNITAKTYNSAGHPTLSSKLDDLQKYLLQCVRNAWIISWEMLSVRARPFVNRPGVTENF
jgi:hypothetical protein